MAMLYEGNCSCGECRVSLSTAKPPEDISPRICDCDYCQKHPSAIISDPDMTIDLGYCATRINSNGDQLARFYHCANCNDMLAVGCDIKGVLLGAVNSYLFAEICRFAEPIQIQPRLLKAEEKLARWEKLWGVLKGV